VPLTCAFTRIVSVERESKSGVGVTHNPEVRWTSTDLYGRWRTKTNGAQSPWRSCIGRLNSGSHKRASDLFRNDPEVPARTAARRSGVVFLAFRGQTGGMDIGTRLRTTGDVARALGVSRQHVVDLCDRGDLAFVWVGKHRRITQREVTRMSSGGVPLLTREQEKSLWLHRALLAYLLVDPNQALAKAHEQIMRWRSVHRSDGMTDHWLGSWDNILEGGIESVVDTLTSRSSQAVELRANSPFAGLLPDDVRRDVLSAFGNWWRQQGRAA